MKILKLLNNLLTILLVLSVFSFKCNSEEPVDIWDLDKIKKEEVKPFKADPKYIGKKMSRNEPRLCGSGKKYKRCCGAL